MLPALGLKRPADLAEPALERDFSRTTYLRRSQAQRTRWADNGIRTWAITDVSQLREGERAPFQYGKYVHWCFALRESGRCSATVCVMANQHPTDGILELYAFSKLAHKEVPAVEEHLLICEICQGAVQTIDDLRLALATLEQVKRALAAPMRA